MYIGLYLVRESLDINFTHLGSQKQFIPPSKNIKHLVFGFNEIVADSLWLRWIQNIDTCGKSLNDRYQVLGVKKIGDSDFSEKITSVQKKLVCDQGWSFRMLDTITDLSPKFSAPYVIGASNLSVIAEDHIGAKIIFGKGAKQFPRDWGLLYRGAYHFLYELNDLKTAADWLKRAADNGAPGWLYSLSSRVNTQSGQIELGIKRLYDYLSTQTDPKVIHSIKERIQSLEDKRAK